MKRIVGVVAIVLGVALLCFVGMAVAVDHPLVHDKAPLKPILWSFVIVSAGVGWISHDDEADAEA